MDFGKSAQSCQEGSMTVEEKNGNREIAEQWG
jgi:hypothetical protein